MRFVTQSHRLTPATCASQTGARLDGRRRGRGLRRRLHRRRRRRGHHHDRAGPGRARSRSWSRARSRPPTPPACCATTARRSRRGSTCSRPRRPRRTGALLELTRRGARGRGRADALERAHRLSAAVADAIAYAPGATARPHHRRRGAGARAGASARTMPHALIALAHAAACRRATSPATC